MFEPLEDQRRLSDQVYEVILRAIVERRVRPAERLILDDIAAELKVSPTPIRDALARLVAEGLVQPTGRRGYCVSRVTKEELPDLYDLRLMCESYAVEKGLPRVGPPLLRQLTELARECVLLAERREPGQRLELARLDRHFHQLLVGLADNLKLLEIFDRLRLHIHAARIGVGPLNPSDALSSYRTEHFRIVALLGAGDVQSTKEAVQQHILYARDRALAALALEQSG